jgi:hypothetical protein
MKKSYILMGGLFILAFSLVFNVAKGWSEEVIPLPEDAVMTQDQSQSGGPMKLNMKFYKSNVPANKINTFFLQEMKNAGWQGGKEKDGALTFKKGQEVVFIVVVPPREVGSPAQFSITRGIPPTMEQMSATKKDKPDQLSFMPLYPNAKQQFLWDLPTGGTSAGYSTDDTIQNVISFYKSRMISYGWYLAEEVPVKEMPINLSGLQKNMPLKDFNISQPEIKGTMIKASLTFRRGKGESCLIHMYSQQLEDSSKLIDLGGNKTKILVTYVENK